MLFLIGLGLNTKGISIEGIEAVKNCKKVYLESYTVDFPYKLSEIEKIVKKKIKILTRIDVESDKLIKESKKENVALLIYGCPLFATTHISLILEAKKQKVKTEIIYSASVFDSIAETGLQLYKFGKISSMPTFQKNFEPDSFLEFVEQNDMIKAHSLILVDIGLEFSKALIQLEKSCLKRDYKLDKIIVCSRLGTRDKKIFYGLIEKLKSKKILSPYCFIIPSEMHFVEEESLKRFLV
jgi:diphthine synthase